jgi:hypothetical protein
VIEISGVSNTWHACSYIILMRGYAIKVVYEEFGDDIVSTCTAEKNDRKFVAENFLSLLGMISIYDNVEYDLNEMKEGGHELSLKIPENYTELVFDENESFGSIM